MLKEIYVFGHVVEGPVIGNSLETKLPALIDGVLTIKDPQLAFEIVTCKVILPLPLLVIVACEPSGEGAILTIPAGVADQVLIVPAGGLFRVYTSGLLQMIFGPLIVIPLLLQMKEQFAAGCIPFISSATQSPFLLRISICSSLFMVVLELNAVMKF